MSTGWQRAFFAMSIAAGEPHDEARRALGEEGAGLAGPIVERLAAGERRARAVALAEALAEVARAVDEMDLARS
jgi:hypothetical protein